MVGDALATAGKVAFGAAVGGGIGLAAGGLQGTLGHLGKNVFESKKLADWETSEDKGLAGWSKRRIGSALRTTSGAAATGSFDLRQGVAGTALKLAGGATGIKLDSKVFLKESGGYEADLKRRDEKRKKRAEGLKVKEGEPEKQHLNQMKEEQQDVTLRNEEALHKIDADITGAEGKVKYLQSLADSSTKKGKDKDNKWIDPKAEENIEAYDKAAQAVKDLKDQRSLIKNGSEILDKNGKGTGVYRTHNGKITEEEVYATNMAADNAQAAEEAAKAAAAAAPAAHAAAQAAEEAAKAAAALAETEALRAAGAARLDPGNAALGTAATEANTRKVAADAAAKKAAADVTAALTAITATADAAIAASNKAKNAAAMASRANTAALGGTGNSQNKYEDKLVPEAEHHVKHLNDIRTRNFANNLQNQFVWPWNEAARKKSAHDIRMGVKPEKSHGGKSGGGGHFASEILAGVIAEKVAGPGHAPAADAGHAADHH
jgi:hypothetical protein